MDTYAKFINRSWAAIAAIALATMCGISTAALAAETDGQKRLSMTMQNTAAQRGDGFAGTVTEDEFGALVTSGARGKQGTRSSAQSKASPNALQSVNNDFWFYTADVVLFNDHDRDGFYHGIDLLFDADTYFTFAEVYAVVYLSYEGGPWNEYAATENFTILGASGDDEYVLVTELMSGYPSGSYDILIELYDAYDYAFLAWYGPDDTSELAFLPLEDADRDAAQGPDVVVVNRGGGGSLGWLSILSLGLMVTLRQRLARRA